ncbi:hypothetical protein [Poriferisphaera sp. WC338]|uniref:hypothetical protein n=1 Tax=Poriferisphaera sp. WC338 TaxID=3425129 RepID=UPI003D815D13
MLNLFSKIAIKIPRNLKGLHSDQRGAESIEKLLIIGLIALPLLILLVWFRNEIATYMRDKWTDVQEDADVDP